MQRDEEGRKKEENEVRETDDWKSGKKKEKPLKKKGKVRIVLGGMNSERECDVLRMQRERG
ncbi:hypothetical protein Csa_012294 [Cucumis sativus]|uniref:Uncharacterized protein n=1 Tax=Cucumis sativus TaxID=3659 RepID=A0A0A0L0M0_CUCSA|nr:hypothetical protein Csa_012294 [Cucumis sativus]